MAINIQYTPPEVAPLSSNSVFQISSDNEDISYFLVEVINMDTSEQIVSLKYHPKPSAPNSVTFDLSNILSNLLDNRFENVEGFMTAVDDAVLSYRIRVSEMLKIDGTIVIGDVHDEETDKYSTWETDLNFLDTEILKEYSYNLNSAVPSKFLTTKENDVFITQTSKEYLYYLDTEHLSRAVRIQWYDENGVLLFQYSSPTPQADIVKINVSPEYFVNIPALELAEFGVATSFTIEVLDGANKVLTEPKRFIIQQLPCNMEVIDIVFKNYLGMYDSLQLFQPIETVSADKTEIKKPLLQSDSNGVLSNKNNGVYNASKRVIYKSITYTYTAFSALLDDFESNWIKQLLTSDEVYVMLPNGDYAPIFIATKSYKITQRISNGGKKNRLELSFTCDTSMKISTSVEASNSNNSGFNYVLNFAF